MAEPSVTERTETDDPAERRTAADRWMCPSPPPGETRRAGSEVFGPAPGDVGAPGVAGAQGRVGARGKAAHRPPCPRSRPRCRGPVAPQSFGTSMSDLFSSSTLTSLKVSTFTFLAKR